MARRFLGVVAGVAVWMVMVTIVGVIMRGAWREYAAVADAMTFTLPMMLARLAIGALATFVAGWVTAIIARRSRFAILACGLLLLVVFIPQHIMLWNKFPVWYHLTFLVSLIPLTWLGGTIAETKTALKGPIAKLAQAGQPATITNIPIPAIIS